MQSFYDVSGVPVHSVLLMPTRAEAVGYPRGDVSLAHCTQCGFISNTRFDPSDNDYSTEYEETQGFSPTFNAFADSLARRMVEQYGVRNQRVLEIGCGKAEFLARMVELGDNYGIGVDPAIVPDRVPEHLLGKLELVQELWPEGLGRVEADFICCRHTLEHIAPTGDFLRTLRDEIGDRTDTLVFFELPETLRVLEEAAFWDVYYEHCSYFTPGSLARLFRRSGFELLELSLDFDDQYILLVARPSAENTAPSLPLEDDLGRTTALVDRYAKESPARIEHWKREISTRVARGETIVPWGAGSKAVAFLTTLGIGDEIDLLVDVNPYKRGRFMPGTGHEVIGPDDLAEHDPDCVIVMNPIYLDEIRRDLAARGLKPELLTV